MRIFVSILFALLSLNVSAQVTTNVYWTTDTELKAKDVIYYNPKHPLVWDDFIGVPKPVGPTAALTASGFGYKASSRSGSDGTEINIGVYCYFSKPDSWVVKGSNNAYVLAHEQLHFDITYIIARAFLDRIKKEKITAQNINTLVPKIYQEFNAQMTAMQEQYDAASRHGIDKEVQSLWQNKISGMLK
jgi:hypothetical protein